MATYTTYTACNVSVGALCIWTSAIERTALPVGHVQRHPSSGPPAPTVTWVAIDAGGKPIGHPFHSRRDAIAAVVARAEASASADLAGAGERADT